MACWRTRNEVPDSDEEDSLEEEDLEGVQGDRRYESRGESNDACKDRGNDGNEGGAKDRGNDGKEGGAKDRGNDGKKGGAKDRDNDGKEGGATDRSEGGSKHPGEGEGEGAWREDGDESEDELGLPGVGGRRGADVRVKRRENGAMQGVEVESREQKGQEWKKQGRKSQEQKSQEQRIHEQTQGITEEQDPQRNDAAAIAGSPQVIIPINVTEHRQGDETPVIVADDRPNTWTNPKNADLFSVPSSPLTEISSSPPEPWNETMDVDQGSQPVTQAMLEDSLDPLEPLEPLVDTNMLHESLIAQRRSTRKRNAIQLNPYRIENQLYRQSIQKAGIAPVRITDGDDNRSEYSDDYQPDAGVDTQDIAHGGPAVETQSDGLGTEQASTQLDIFWDDDEAPDLDTLLARTAGKPKQKVYSSRHAGPAAQRDDAGSRLATVSALEGSRLAAENHASHQDLLSPPPSSPSPRRQPKSPKIFRYPPGATPPQLVTPAVSSDVRPRRNVIDDLSDDELPAASSNVLMTRASDEHRAHPSHEVETESSDGNHSDGSDVAIQSFRRKIKGVLPASWLRIDQKKQVEAAHRASKRAAHDSPPRTAHRGVARPMPKRTRASETRVELPSIAIASSAGSESEQDIPTHDVTALPSHSAPPQYPDHATDLGCNSDSMEEDHIDPMLPAEPRRRQRAAITHPASRKNSHKIFGIRGAKRQSKISDHIHDRGRRRKSSNPPRRDPSLSIVDVFAASHEPLPPFLRIALRTTKRRQDRGRQLPYRKVIRLAPAGQTDEGRDTLEQWLEQAIDLPPPTTAPKESRILPRAPLRPVSSNPQPRISGPRPKTPSSITARPAYRQTSARKQETLEQVLTRQLSSTNIKRSTTSSSRDPWSRARNHRSNAISSHLRDQNATIPAQLEDTVIARNSSYRQRETHFSIQHPSRRSSANQAPMLERFVQSHEQDRQDPQSTSHNGHFQEQSSARPRHTGTSRKRAPHQVHIQAVPTPAYYVEAVSLPQATLSDETLHDTSTPTQLENLGSYGTRFPRDFDIEPLPPGSRVGTGTLLEKDYIREAFEDQRRDLAVATPLMNVVLGQTQSQWGPWNETVSAEIGQILQEAHEYLSTFEAGSKQHHEVLNGLDAINNYVSSYLWFLDAIDRAEYLERLLGLLATISQAMPSCLSTTVTSKPTNFQDDGQFLALGTRVLILSHQIANIAQDAFVGEAIRSQANAIVLGLVRTLIQGIFHDGISDFFQYYQVLANCSGERASERSKIKAEALTITLWTCQRDFPGNTFLDIMQETEPLAYRDASRDVQHLERKWFSLFVMQPFLQPRADGIVPTSITENTCVAAWPLVLQLLAPVFQAYDKLQTRHQLMQDEYCRAVLGRCFTLLTRWSWPCCELILRALYDFFAKSNLQNLPLEDAVGHPQFLANFQVSTLTLDRSDKAFHIFLKIMGVGLSRMSRAQPEKALRNIAFRLTPNHSRSLPKEESVKQQDLDSLRNHHNLLCLLYLVLPPSCRPRLKLIRDLIRFEDSHRQACHISVRTWTDLALFQLSSQEPFAVFEPLAEWFNEILAKLLRQHALARKEVEDHEAVLSAETKEAIISSNQRQVEAMLGDTLHAAELVLPKARNVESANALLSSGLPHVFSLYDANVPRINSVLISTLKVVDKYLAHHDHMTATSDSQDFGDWAAFEEFMPPQQNSVGMPDGILKSLHNLLSDCLGSSSAIDERLTIRAVSTWVTMACLQVKASCRQWNDFLDHYGRESWFNFPQTAQTLKHTPLFLSMVISKDPSAYDDHQQVILKSWLTSLVERESQLKYQPDLTCAILNRDRENPLLENLPFWKDPATDLFKVSLPELSTRRLSLISCLLSNMAESLLFSSYHGLTDTQAKRHEYVDLLKVLMKAMKDNYNAFQNGHDVKGAYVEFVQAVAGALQQYTNHILPIDRFFTDAKNFPLPVHDPGYVISRLKSYQAKLGESQGSKQLVTFIQSVIERAVSDGQQEYLISQLRAALTDNFEHGNSPQPTLRTFVLCSLSPAYVAVACESECGWLYAEPLLQAIAGVLANVLTDMDSANPQSIMAVASTLQSLLLSLQHALGLLIDDPTRLKLPVTVRLLALIYGVITAILRPLDYCIRLQPETLSAGISTVASFRSLAAYAFGVMQGLSIEPPIRKELVQSPPCTNEAVFSYATAGLKTALSKWRRSVSHEHGGYELHGAGGMRRVHSNLGSFSEERDALKDALISFDRSVGRFPSFASLHIG